MARVASFKVLQILENSIDSIALDLLWSNDRAIADAESARETRPSLKSCFAARLANGERSLRVLARSLARAATSNPNQERSTLARQPKLVVTH